MSGCRELGHHWRVGIGPALPRDGGRRATFVLADFGRVYAVLNGDNDVRLRLQMSGDDNGFTFVDNKQLSVGNISQ